MIEPVEVNAVADWEKFVGNYEVYDTLGVWLYSMDISHHSGLNEFGVEMDSLMILNFADSFDLDIQFSFATDDRYLDIGFHSPVYAHSGYRWYLDGNYEDSGTPVLDNTLINDSIHLFFTMDNIAYFTADGVPFYSCECRQIALKQ